MCLAPDLPLDCRQAYGFRGAHTLAKIADLHARMMPARAFFSEEIVDMVTGI
jgi:hypothetical protein